jgi:hypothetical protein
MLHHRVTVCAIGVSVAGDLSCSACSYAAQLVATHFTAKPDLAGPFQSLELPEAHPDSSSQRPSVQQSNLTWCEAAGWMNVGQSTGIHIDRDGGPLVLHRPAHGLHHAYSGEYGGVKTAGGARRMAAMCCCSKMGHRPAATPPAHLQQNFQGIQCSITLCMAG